MSPGNAVIDKLLDSIDEDRFDAWINNEFEPKESSNVIFKTLNSFRNKTAQRYAAIIKCLYNMPAHLDRNKISINTETYECTVYFESNEEYINKFVIMLTNKQDTYRQFEYKRFECSTSKNKKENIKKLYEWNECNKDSFNKFYAIINALM